MGARNIDRITASGWRQKCEFVWEMIAEAWRVEAYCPLCFDRRRVDLVELARRRGPEFSLWNVRAPCRRDRIRGCRGEVVFMARPLAGIPAFALSEHRIAPRPPFHDSLAQKREKPPAGAGG